MKTILFTFVVLLSMAQKQCGHASQPVIPACIQARIDSIRQQPKWNPPAEVTEYRYNGKRVFHFSSNCCDQFNEVVDDQCNYICAPSGGFTGKGDGRCAGFYDKAEMIKVVWKDERK